MWGFIAQPGLATAVVDVINIFFPLGVGLYGLLALSAGLLTAVAIRHARAQATQPAAEPTYVPTSYRQAA
jgi:hypothetical protein